MFSIIWNYYMKNAVGYRLLIFLKMLPEFMKSQILKRKCLSNYYSCTFFYSLRICAVTQTGPKKGYGVLNIYLSLSWCSAFV